METIDLKKHVLENKRYYDPGVLVPQEHFRLVQDIERLAQKAKIPSGFITHTMKDFCKDSEVSWVKSLKAHQMEGISGLAYVGSTIKHVEDRMMAIAGACIRNYIDARVYTVQEVLEHRKEGTMPDCKVLLIPNFFLKKDAGGDLPSWHISDLLGMLYSRYSSGLYTVLYIQSLEGLAAGYGVTFRSHIEDHYSLIKS